MTEGESAPTSSSADVPPFRRLDRHSSANSPNLVGVIDEGTSRISFSIYKTPDFKEIASHSVSIEMISPQDGWYEQNPKTIMNSINMCCQEACALLPATGHSVQNIEAIGITNQRETTIVWDRVTGEPLYNALIWKDIRPNAQVDRILSKLPEHNKDHFKSISGLPVSPYFSALKIMWLKENVPAVRKACREGRCLAGTVDSWIVWNLTKGKLHITDVTNASRTLLMNIKTLNWDHTLLKTFSIDIGMLPEIRTCSEIYGRVEDAKHVLFGVPISCILGNQQASLLGQMCIKPGQAKNTYRSGCFLLCNTGQSCIISSRGLLTTVAYKLGPKAPTIYALEGSVAVAGHALRWLQNRVRILPDALDAEKLAETVPTTGDVYFVPAFTGLYAPYWRKDARGIICGLTQFTTKQHIIRASLESICYQTRDILECFLKEGGFELTKLHADGKLTSNNLLMQLQADIGGVPVFRSQLLDSTAFGAAMCAAQAEGINLTRFEPEKRYYENVFYDTFLPTSTLEERKHRYAKWKRAVERSLGWSTQTKTSEMTEERYRLLGSIPAAVYIMSVFAMVVHAGARMKR